MTPEEIPSLAGLLPTRSLGRCVSKTANATSLRWKVVFENFWCIEQFRSVVLLGILELEKEVQMTDEDTDELEHTATRYYQVESAQHPRQIHCLELRS